MNKRSDFDLIISNKLKACILNPVLFLVAWSEFTLAKSFLVIGFCSELKKLAFDIHGTVIISRFQKGF